ncbi:MAG: hypothetical protein HOJ06_08010 [Rhodospirillaceae bacterium]|nr:hypothetical protein [Rhodospirillaceae bacterium]
MQSHIDLLRSDLEAAVGDLQNQIDDLVASQAAQDLIIAAIQTAADLLQDRVAENEGDIDALQAADDFLAQLIQALDDRLTLLEARVTDNEGDIAAILLADQVTQNLINAIQAQIANLNLRIIANDGDISTLQSLVGSLLTQLNSLQTQLAAKQNRVLGVCGPGSSIRQINSNGSVICEPDSVSAGVGSLSTLRVTETQEIPSAGLTAGSLSLSATCPSTHRVTGGGYQISGFGTGVLPISGDPRFVKVLRTRSSGNDWNVRVSNDNIVVDIIITKSFQTRLDVYAQCGRVQ